MATRNVADVQLWWRHPNYTPHHLSRVRNKTNSVTSTAIDDFFQMDASFDDIDELTIGSGVGQSFTVKEYLGVGQVRKRRRQVNVADVKELTGSFVCNFGSGLDTPEQFFSAMNADPGIGGNGVKRPCALRVVFDVEAGLSAASTTADAFAVDGAKNAGDGTLDLDGRTGTESLKVGDAFTIAGNNTIYRVVSGGSDASADFTVGMTPVLAANAADNAVVTKVRPQASALAASGSRTINFDNLYGAAVFEPGQFVQFGNNVVAYEILSRSGTGTTGAITVTPNLTADVADNTHIHTRPRNQNLDKVKNGNACDYVIAEFDYDLTPDGEVMGNFSLQAAGTGFEYIRAA